MADDSEKQPKTADGVPIVLGMKVAHFMDEWKNAGEVLLIDRDVRHGGFDVTFRNEYGGKCEYRTEIIFGSEAGLLRDKIARAEEIIRRFTEIIESERTKVNGLRARLAAVEQTTTV